MSAVENVAASTSSSAPADEGPREIKVVGQDPIDPPSSDPKSGVTDAEPKAKTELKTELKTGEGDDLSDDESGNRDSKGRFKGVQSRIDELTRARREAEREAEYWRIRANGSPQAQTPAQQAAKDKPPVRADYQSDEAFVDALADYKVEQKLAERDAKAASKTEATQKATAWDSKLQAARAEFADYSEVMDNADVPVAMHVAELIMEHEHGAKIAYHFAKNPEQLAKVNEMTPAKVAFEIGKLATKFESNTASSNQSSAPPKRESSAPPPAKTIGQGRSTTPDLADMPMEDYIKQRKAQGASWAR